MSVFNKDGCREPLVIPVDVLMLQGSLEERVKHVESNLVPSEQGSFDAHAAKGSDANPSVQVTAERASPMLEKDSLPRTLGDKVLNGVLVCEEVASLERAERVLV